MVRGKIDDTPPTRGNSFKRIGMLIKRNIEVIRYGFKCEKCHHTKAFYKRDKGYECTKCKHLQNKKRGVV